MENRDRKQIGRIIFEEYHGDIWMYAESDELSWVDKRKMKVAEIVSEKKLSVFFSDGETLSDERYDSFEDLAAAYEDRLNWAPDSFDALPDAE